MMVNKLSFSLFCLIKNFLLTLWFYYRWTRKGDEKKEKKKQKKRKSKSTTISLHTREKTSSSSSNIAPYTKSIGIGGKCVMPTIIIILLSAIKPWDKDAMITISIEEASFGIAYNQLVFKDEITQV